MTDKNTSKTEVRAGVSETEEAAARKEAKATANEEVTAEVTPTPTEGLLKELPDNGIAAVREGSTINEDGEIVITPTAIRVGEASAPTFADEFHGVGGSYVIDPDTGERKRQYEEVFSDKGKSLGFRPVP